MKFQVFIERMGLNLKHFFHFFFKDGHAVFKRRNRTSIFKKGIIAIKSDNDSPHWHVLSSNGIKDMAGTLGLGMFVKKGKIINVSSLEYFDEGGANVETYASNLNEFFFGGVVYMEDLDELEDGDSEMAVLVMVSPEENLNDAVVFLTAYERTQILELRSIAKMFFYGLGSVENLMFSRLFREEEPASERITEK